MDNLKKYSVQLKGKIASQNLTDINFKERSFRTLSVRDYRNYRIEIDDFGDLYFTMIKVSSDFFTLSINNPNRLSSIDRQVTHDNSPYKLYIFKKSYSKFIKGHRYNPFVSDVFKSFWNTFINIIKDLKLSNDETISIREDGIGLALRVDRDLSLVLDEIINLIDKNKDVFKMQNTVKIFKKNIPENLQVLLPLMKKWAIPDDGEREQAIEGLSNNQKVKLINMVEPFMNEINKFLDSFEDGALTHEATLLGNLAELVSELMVEKE